MVSSMEDFLKDILFGKTSKRSRKDGFVLMVFGCFWCLPKF